MSKEDLCEVRFASEKKGRGLFATRAIKKSSVIMIGDMLLLSNKDYEMIQDTVLYGYTFTWDAPNLNGEFENAIALSKCQFINHSYDPNARYDYDYRNLKIIFTSIKNIEKDEELTVNYNGIPKDKSPVWFEVEEE